MPKSSSELSAPIEEVYMPSEEMSEDKDLVLAFKRGVDGSYQAIYIRYLPRVRGICRRMLTDSHDAEEAQQETFMRVFTSLPNFNGRYQLGAWVSRIATNVCVDHLRSKSRKLVDSTDQTTLELSVETSEGPEDSFLAADERQEVRAVLARLAPMHRAALALREFEGMSYTDIAVALGMTEPQVKALIHRARKAFKKQWAPGLAALLPWRLIARIRKFSHHYDAPPQMTDAAVSTVHFANSCSAALQQCGAFMSEKVASAMTAVIVGAAAVTGVVGTSDAASAPKMGHPDETRVAALVVSKEKADPKRKDKKKRGRLAAAASHTEGSSGVEAQPDPEVSPTPSSSPTPPPAQASPAPGAEGSADNAPPEKPTPPSLAFARGTVVASGQPTSSTVTVECESTRVEQRLESQISYDGQLYPALFTFSSGQMTLTVTKEDQAIGYNGGGELTSKTTAKGYMDLVYAGSYGWNGTGNPSSSKLPYSGTFRAELRLDCARSSVVTESLVFGVN